MNKRIGVALVLIVTLLLIGISFLKPVEQNMPPSPFPAVMGVDGDRIIISVEDFPDRVPERGDSVSTVIENSGWRVENVEDDVGELEEFDGTLVILNVGSDFFIEMAIENGRIVSVESETNLRYKYRYTAEPLK